MPHSDTEKYWEYQRQYRFKNKDKIRDQKREYRKNNSEELKAKGRANAVKNRENRKVYARKYRSTNKEYLKEVNKQYYADHSDKIQAYQKEYYKQNYDKVNARNKIYRKGGVGRGYQKEFRKRGSAELADWFVRAQFKHKHKGLKGVHIPNVVIELKRAQLRIIRLIKSIEKGEHHVESKTCI